MKKNILGLCILMALAVSGPTVVSAQENKDNLGQDKPNNPNQINPAAPVVPDPANRDQPRNGQLNRDLNPNDPLNPVDRLNPNARPVRTFEGRVTSKTADSILIGGKTYKIDKQTKFDRNGSLTSVKVGDVVHGYIREDGPGMYVTSLGMGALRDRRPVRDQTAPGLNQPGRDPLNPNRAVPADPIQPGIVPIQPVPGTPINPDNPAVPGSPGNPRIPAVPKAPSAPAAPAPGVPK